MNLKQLEEGLIRIINNGLDKVDSISLKHDNSVVTECDIKIEENIIQFLKENFTEIEIVSEENIESHKETYHLKNKFAIIDPIDGTENFYFLQNIFGCAISVVYNDLDYHLIYLPTENKVISTITNPDFTQTKSNIELYSTSCLGLLNEKKEKQSARILGSSSFMFYTLLSAAAQSYKYCGKAKIWDYYTGISLALKSRLKFRVKFGDTIIKKMPLDIPHKCDFQIDIDE
jgi:3'-phosphoadenosine 5'-phosphosulfate (PAPS) 3'-phosphatase